MQSFCYSFRKMSSATSCDSSLTAPGGVLFSTMSARSATVPSSQPFVGQRSQKYLSPFFASLL